MTTEVTSEETPKKQVPAGLPRRGKNPKLPSRRKGYVAAVLSMAVLGASLAWMGTRSTGSHEVLMVKNDLFRGQTIKQEDLTSLSVEGEQPQYLDINRQADVVGTKAQTNLLAGTPVIEGSFASAMPVPEDMSIVGLGLKPSNMPGRELVPGDKVRVVHTPSGEQLTGDETLQTVAAVIERYPTASEDAEGNSNFIVDIRVKKADAPRIVTWSSSGLVGIVLDGEK